MSTKPWGGIGAWAAESEREEAEEAAAAATASSSESKSFPTLKEAASSKPTKKKKKQALTLSEFTTGVYVGPGGAYHRDSASGLTPDEMVRLPTGPKERTADEMQHGRLGGGFSSYGARNNDGGGRRSYGGGFDDDRRDQAPRVSDFDLPSRADEVDNWSLSKKTIPSFLSGDSGARGGGNRYESLGGDGGGFSRSDEVGNWGAGKKPLRVIKSSSSSFGSQFRDSSGSGPDRWVREGPLDGEGGHDRPRLVLDPRSGGNVVGNEQVKTSRPNPFGNARPREEILSEKGLDWKKLDLDIEAKKTSSRPTSSHSSRPSSAHSARSEATVGVEEVVKPARPKVNPFGDAKPREVLLEEKGMDWRKIDWEFENRGVIRHEAEEEKQLKEEIDQLKKKLDNQSAANVSSESLQGPDGGNQSSLQDSILQKERDLGLLVRDLDDKAKLGQKAIDRPGSGAGRVSSYFERPHSQSGPYDESRGMGFMDRPRSRGTGSEERRGFQGGREKAFLGNRDMDRSRDRW